MNHNHVIVYIGELLMSIRMLVLECWLHWQQVLVLDCEAWNILGIITYIGISTNNIQGLGSYIPTYVGSQSRDMNRPVIVGLFTFTR